MVEGGSSRDFRHVKGMLYSQPQALHQLLTVLADSVADYLLAQIEAGAQVVQIFDTWGGALSRHPIAHGAPSARAPWDGGSSPPETDGKWYQRGVAA